VLPASLAATGSGSAIRGGMFCSSVMNKAKGPHGG
jgi:hypothetical protein